MSLYSYRRSPAWNLVRNAVAYHDRVKAQLETPQARQLDLFQEPAFTVLMATVFPDAGYPTVCMGCGEAGGVYPYACITLRMRDHVLEADFCPSCAGFTVLDQGLAS